MSKKKKSKKRHVSKGTGRPVQSSPAAVTAAPTEAKAEALSTNISSNEQAKSVKEEAIDPRWGYVGRDVHRVTIIGSICIALLLGLWVLFANTSIDENLYQLIKL